MANQNENSIKEKIRNIDNINKVVNEKKNEIEKLKSEVTTFNKKISGYKKEIEEKKQALAKEQRNKEKIDAAFDRALALAKNTGYQELTLPNNLHIII